MVKIPRMVPRMEEDMRIRAEYVRSRFVAMQAPAGTFGTLAQGAMRQGAGRARKDMAVGREARPQAAQEAMDQTWNMRWRDAGLDWTLLTSPAGGSCSGQTLGPGLAAPPSATA